LACYIATLEALWWVKEDDVYRRLSAFWIKTFAVSFGLGVVSGIVMPFQFDINWSRYIAVILMYVARSCWVFRGKVRERHAYH
jgi:cytochrome d ubiquinol oxidase subunit I